MHLKTSVGTYIHTDMYVLAMNKISKKNTKCPHTYKIIYNIIINRPRPQGSFKKTSVGTYIHTDMYVLAKNKISKNNTKCPNTFKIIYNIICNRPRPLRPFKKGVCRQYNFHPNLWKYYNIAGTAARRVIWT